MDSHPQGSPGSSTWNGWRPSQKLFLPTIQPVVMRNTACKNVCKDVTPYKVHKLTRRKGKGVLVLFSEGRSVENSAAVFQKSCSSSYLAILYPAASPLICPCVPNLALLIYTLIHNPNSRVLVFTVLDARRLRSERGGSPSEAPVLGL